MSAPRTVTANFNKYRTFSDNGFFVCQQYLDLLGRTPDTSGYNYWVGLLNSSQATRGQVADAFFVSPEFQGNGMFIISAYIAVLGRNPDYAGWLYWLGNLQAGVPPLGHPRLQVVQPVQPAGVIRIPSQHGDVGRDDEHAVALKFRADEIGVGHLCPGDVAAVQQAHPVVVPAGVRGPAQQVEILLADEEAVVGEGAVLVEAGGHGVRRAHGQGRGVGGSRHVAAPVVNWYSQLAATGVNWTGPAGVVAVGGTGIGGDAAAGRRRGLQW